ncbi:unnamed protein product [Nippostrongylus brasiliensis]|uniref:Uncharacterized protein n=1 Tax=Nippostrongylus brasiliensis TaxID=27835 RepID=A0A0N4YDE4_NIPBR|nr:unnamed protein product [Nippostrongylus brasiliensis]
MSLTYSRSLTQSQAANGSAASLLGSITLPIQIGQYQLTHKLHVSSDNECPAPLLLGTNFIRSLNLLGLTVTFDMHMSIVTVGSDFQSTSNINYVVSTPPASHTARIAPQHF